jgi:hypothetical protein
LSQHTSILENERIGNRTIFQDIRPKRAAMTIRIWGERARPSNWDPASCASTSWVRTAIGTSACSPAS